MIVILDNGGQYVHRIYRSLKYIGVSSKIIPNTTPLEEIESNEEVKGIYSVEDQILRRLKTA